MGKWPSIHRKTERPGHQMAAETVFFRRTGYGGIILTNLKVIWDMSVQKSLQSPDAVLFYGSRQLTGVDDRCSRAIHRVLIDWRSIFGPLSVLLTC
jgi:hypothetical protein